MIARNEPPEGCVIVNGHHRTLAIKNVAENMGREPVFSVIIYFEENEEDGLFLESLALNNPGVPGIPDFQSVIIKFFITQDRMK